MTKTQNFLCTLVAAGGFLIAAGSVYVLGKRFVSEGMGSGTATGSVQEMGNIKTGQTAPDFTLQDLSDKPVALSSFRGQKVVLMDFWATWCGPCRMSMPGLQALADKYQDHGLEILSLDQGETAEPVRDFIQKQKYTFHVLLDKDHDVGGKYGVQGIPTLVLIDKNGVVQWIRVGYSGKEDDLQQLVEKLTKA
jgi:peroxiredoxin